MPLIILEWLKIDAMHLIYTLVTKTLFITWMSLNLDLVRINISLLATHSSALIKLVAQLT